MGPHCIFRKVINTNFVSAQYLLNCFFAKIACASMKAHSGAEIGVVFQQCVTKVKAHLEVEVQKITFYVR